jgi:hypothetical protein
MSQYFSGPELLGIVCKNCFFGKSRAWRNYSTPVGRGMADRIARMFSSGGIVACARGFFVVDPVKHLILLMIFSNGIGDGVNSRAQRLCF